MSNISLIFCFLSISEVTIGSDEFSPAIPERGYIKDKPVAVDTNHNNGEYYISTHKCIHVILITLFQILMHVQLTLSPLQTALVQNE